MRILALGDILGNAAALEAVLAEADRIAPDRIYHTGNLVGIAPRPNETIDVVRSRGIAGVRGNFDESLAYGGSSPDESLDEGTERVADVCFAWTKKRLERGHRAFLGDLPFSLEAEAGARRLLVFHASPVDLYLPIDETTPDAVLQEMIEETGADLHLFGATGRPLHRQIDGRHFVNAGSVGAPLDGDPRPCLAIVDLDGGVRVEFRRITYDAEAVAREAETAGLPPEIARRLRTGG